MASYRGVTILSSAKSFICRNKKPLICALVAFLVGIVIGVLSAIRATEGQFDRVARIDMEFGSAKVFFISALAILGGYIVIVLSALKVKTVFLGVIPFVILGFFMGEYSTALIARYEVMGVLNMVFVYMPLFCGSCAFMAIALCVVSSAPLGIAGCSAHQKQPMLLSILKIFGLNMATNFVFVMIIGSFIGVILVSLY